MLAPTQVLLLPLCLPGTEVWLFSFLGSRLSGMKELTLLFDMGIWAQASMSIMSSLWQLHAH